VPKLRLSLEKFEGEDHIRVQALVPERLQVHGFGSFMVDIEDEEIEITDGARTALLAGRSRGGLQGMEFWPERRLAWGSIPNHDFLVPVQAISVPSGAKEWIKLLKG
jgi:hypothetical protein